MPVSKKRVKNLQATKSKKLSSQSEGDKSPSSRRYIIIIYLLEEGPLSPTVWEDSFLDWVGWEFLTLFFETGIRKL